MPIPHSTALGFSGVLHLLQHQVHVFERMAALFRRQPGGGGRDDRHPLRHRVRGNGAVVAASRAGRAGKAADGRAGQGECQIGPGDAVCGVYRYKEEVEHAAELQVAEVYDGLGGDIKCIEIVGL